MEDEMVVPYARLRRKEKYIQELNEESWRKVSTWKTWV
jgi:glucose-6-phosphate isomerase